MISLFLGIAAFVLYLIYDINSYTCRSRFLHLFFAVGTVLLCAATGIDLWYAWRNGAFRGIGDILLLTGKGHEEYEIRGRERLPFSERETVLACIARRREREGRAD